MDRLGAGVWVLLGQSLQSLVNFGTIMALGYWAGQEELGVFALGFSFCFLAVSLGDTLVATPYTYFQSQGSEGMRSYFSAAMLSNLALVSVVIALFWIGLWFRLYSLSVLGLVLPLALIGLVNKEFFRRHLYVANKLAYSFKFDFLSSAIQFGLVSTLILMDALSAATAFAVIACASLLPTFLGIYRERDLFGWRSWGDGWLRMQSFVRYGRWLALGGGCHVASLQLYPWLALLGGGMAQVGNFAACMALTNLVNPLLVGFTNYLRPQFMRRYAQCAEKGFVVYVVRWGVCFALPAVVYLLFIFLFGSDLLVLLYGEAYRVGANALTYMGFGVVAIALSAPLQLAFLAMRAPVTNLIYHGTALLMLGSVATLFAENLSLPVLGAFYGGINTAAFVVLLALFWWRSRAGY
jgi:O-antigen/teichoic acid export membrane protein